MKTYLSKEKLAEMLTEEETAVYVALKIMFDKMLTQERDYVEVNCNISNLYYELSGSFELTKTDKAKIENGLKSLIEEKFIDLIDTDNKGNYVLNIANLYIDSNEAYTTVKREEIRNVISIPYKQKYNLLRLALAVYGTIYSDSKCSFASISKLQDLTGIKHPKTVIDMMKVFEDNNIFYVCHADTAKRDTNGQIKQLSNVYGRPEDKTAIYNCYIQRLQKQGHDFTNKMTSQRKAEITRNYNKFVKGKYKDDIIKLIQECLVYNDLPYAEKKDLSVFTQENILLAQEGLNEVKKDIRDEVKELKQQKINEDIFYDNNISYLNTNKIYNDMNVNDIF